MENSGHKDNCWPAHSLATMLIGIATCFLSGWPIQSLHMCVEVFSVAIQRFLLKTSIVAVM